jgi:hypothetical protein
MVCDDRRSGQWPLLTSTSQPGLVVVDVDGELSLFGFAARHPGTGGLSWMPSTEIVELDESAGRARTSSGRVCALGVTQEELDEEGSHVDKKERRRGPPLSPRPRRVSELANRGPCHVLATGDGGCGSRWSSLTSPSQPRWIPG